MSEHGARRSPRAVAPKVQIALFFSGFWPILGLIFTVFGIALASIFAAQTDITSLIYFRESDPVTVGRVTRVVPTGNSEGWKRTKSERVFAYHYRYMASGNVYEGHSYALFGHAAQGGNVLVKYSLEKPSLSRIDGMQAAPFAPGVVALTGAFPAFGLLILYFSTKKFARNLHLVQHGIVTTGRVGRKEATSTTINKQRVYRVFFRFKTADGSEYELFAETHELDRLRDERDEPLVYDPGHPRTAVLLDTLSPKVRHMLTAN